VSEPRVSDDASAIELAEQVLQQSPDDPRAILAAADGLLRSGHADRAVEFFDRYLQLRPADLPGLWQRGIALYFDGQYAVAADQFVKHREVNPYDVENAAWHYLCVAKAESVANAKQSVLPAPHDARIPMAEVHKMLVSGDRSVVENRLQNLSPESPRHDSAMFYGNFYLGLFADAHGDHQTAVDNMTQAAQVAPRHYMGDIARVYLEHLKQQPLEQP
jgi:lipoprotein NlpI